MKAINLGLSVMWGDCNIGAKECYEAGTLYSWKEIIPEVNHLTSLRAPVAIPSSMKIDLAEKLYGHGWQIPTIDHIIELMENCEFEFALMGKALRVTGPNKNSILLPLAGNEDRLGNKVRGGFYWSSTKASEDCNSAYQLHISDSQVIYGYNLMTVCQSVRPVYCPTDNVKNYNKVAKPVLYTKADYNYVISQLTKLCKELNITFKISDLKKANRNIIDKVRTVEQFQTFELNPQNALGHGNITFIYIKDQRLVGILIEKASEEYINSVRNSGMVYGIILGSGTITYGADNRTDTIVDLKPDEIYVRLF